MQMEHQAQLTVPTVRGEAQIWLLVGAKSETDAPELVQFTDSNESNWIVGITDCINNEPLSRYQSFIWVFG